MDADIRPGLPQPRDQIVQVILRAQSRMRRAMQQAYADHQVVFGAGDGTRQILILFVVAVKECQLLLAMGRIVERIDVQRQVFGRLGKRCNELINQVVLQLEEALYANRVLESRECRLACQIVIVDRSAAEKLENRIAAQHVVVVLIGVIGQDAIDS